MASSAVVREEVVMIQPPFQGGALVSVLGGYRVDHVSRWTRPSTTLAARWGWAGLALVLVLGCGRDIDTGPRHDRAGLAAVPLVEIIPPPLPPIGVAVADSGSTWCAEFPADSTILQPGTPITLVFPGPAPVAALAARLAGARSGECPTAFPQPRWLDYRASRLETDPPPVPESLPIVALVVTSEAPWTRGDDGIVRADLDGDGSPEEARRCLSGEGEHLTIWSTRPDGTRDRRAHEYFDWGAEVDATCGPGEDGVDLPGG